MSSVDVVGCAGLVLRAMAAAAPRFSGFSIGGAKPRAPLPAAAALPAHADEAAPPQATREFIAAVSSSGGIELSAGAAAAAEAGRRRLVIPLAKPLSIAPAPPQPVALEVSAPPPPPPHPPSDTPERTLDQLAAEQLLEELGGSSRARGAQPAGPLLVIGAASVPATDADASSAPVAPPAYEYNSAARHRDVDPALMAKLFNPSQKRVTGHDASAPPILMGRGGGGGGRGGGNNREGADAGGDSFAQDLAGRPADMAESSDAYDRVPIDQFGAAMLRGMGVAESVLSTADGQSSNDGGGGGGAAAAVAASGGSLMRQARQGLGASSGARAVMSAIAGTGGSDRRPVHVKPGDVRASKPTLEELMGGVPNGGSSSTTTAAAKGTAAAAIRARKFPGVVDGAVVVVTTGRHTGKTALVTQCEGVPGMEKCRVRVCLRGRRNAYGLAEGQPASDVSAAPASEAAATVAAVLTGADGALSWGGLSEGDTDVVVVGKAECRTVSSTEGGGLDALPPAQRAEVDFLTAVEKKAREAVKAVERAERAALEARLRAEDAERSARGQRGALAADSIGRGDGEGGGSGRAPDSTVARAVGDDRTNSRQGAHQRSSSGLIDDRGRRRSRSRSRGEDRDRDRRREPAAAASTSSASYSSSSSSSAAAASAALSSDVPHRDARGQSSTGLESSGNTTSSHSSRHAVDLHRQDYRPSSSSSSSSSSSRSSSDRGGGSSGSGGAGSSSSSRQRTYWLLPHIRVRIIDERSGHYKCKGLVRDVVRPGVATVQLDGDGGSNGRLLENVPQHSLETALPKPGGTVVVVVDASGRLLRARGVLLDRDSARSRVTLRLLEDGVVVSLPMDDVAECVVGEGEHE